MFNSGRLIFGNKFREVKNYFHQPAVRKATTNVISEMKNASNLHHNETLYALQQLIKCFERTLGKSINTLFTLNN